MAESKHTPGPWTLGTGSQTGTGYAVCAGPQVLATVNGFGYPLNIGRAPGSDANAALIAAAPDMYDALEAFRVGLSDGSIAFTAKRQSDSDPYHPANVAMCAALARAEGREDDADEESRSHIPAAI